MGLIGSLQRITLAPPRAKQNPCTHSPLATSHRSLPLSNEFRHWGAISIAGDLSDGFRREWRG
jgi:hypothetical protein